jgi:DNA/RNA endonuclease YhcR with UshA esterase domain
MKLKLISITLLLSASLLIGCGGQTTTDPDALPPCQVDSSMIDQVVKVRGEILWVVQNPGGLGGLYCELGDGTGEVGVRIKSHIWESLDESEKSQFEEGQTVTVEGVLFPAGGKMIVIFGEYSPSSPDMPDDME